MKIGIIGTRGIPARYGGFETCAEEISIRLSNMGHEITVYCRNDNSDSLRRIYKGVRLIHLPYLKGKHLGTFTHTFLSVIHSLFHSYDCLFCFNVGIAPLLLIPKLFGQKLFLNVDGLEWKRSKWGIIPKLYFKLCEWMAPKIALKIITDSLIIKKYYRKTYGLKTELITYGAYRGRSITREKIKKFNVNPNQYFLVISRLEPENNGEIIINAFSNIITNKKLLILGTVQYRSEYLTRLLAVKKKEIIFHKPEYDKDVVRELICNCYGYIHGNEIGGTSPGLIQAMVYGSCILSIDADINRLVGQDNMIYFKKSQKDLESKLNLVLSDLTLVGLMRKKVRNYFRNNDQYSWDKIASNYERLQRFFSS